MDSRLVTIDEQFCATVQAISPVQEIGISHVAWAVFVIEPDRQQAIIIQCLSALCEVMVSQIHFFLKNT